MNVSEMDEEMVWVVPKEAARISGVSGGDESSARMPTAKRQE